MNEEDRAKGGISSLWLRIIAYIILTATVVLRTFYGSVLPWVEYFNWLSYPIFAFLLAEGFSQTSSKIRYFIRLLLFALIAEVPYNFLTSGKVFNPQAQNGMFTLCLGFIVMVIVDFVYQKTYNTILAVIALYLYGWGAYYVAKLFNCEFYSFGVMFILIFFASNNIKYPKLLLLVFMGLLTFYLSTDTYVSFIIGNIQYTLPYRTLACAPIILTWFYKGQRGSNGLGLKIFMYAFYPLLLLIVFGLKYFNILGA